AKLIDALAEGFKALARGEVQAPPRPKVDVPGKGFSLGMLAWMPGRHIALKTVNVFHDNEKLGLDSHQALVSVFSAETGAPLAVLEGGSLTALRTSAAAMLSTRMLARDDAKTALVIGGGVEASEHVRQLGLVRNFEEIRVFARKPDAAKRLASLVPNGIAVADLEAAVRAADVVAMTTASASAVIKADWVQPGTHVTSVGFAPPGSELPLALVERSRLFVEAMAAFEPAPVGCAELAGRDPSAGAALGEVLLGRKCARTSSDEITLYKSMGHAMEDMIAANLAYETAIAAGVGVKVEV
ncbi:MAG: ornithine cyclodeaminase family protein, partial [Proteobacteria bacterium]|nr:ornithine cyclodeaminase family protein [Pseudomonadota bacterium]